MKSCSSDHNISFSFDNVFRGIVVNCKKLAWMNIVTCEWQISTAVCFSRMFTHWGIRVTAYQILKRSVDASFIHPWKPSALWIKGTFERYVRILRYSVQVLARIIILGVNVMDHEGRPLVLIASEHLNSGAVSTRLLSLWRSLGNGRRRMDKKYLFYKSLYYYDRDLYVCPICSLILGEFALWCWDNVQQHRLLEQVWYPTETASISVFWLFPVHRWHPLLEQVWYWDRIRLHALALPHSLHSSSYTVLRKIKSLWHL